MSQAVELELTLNELKSYSGRKPLDFEVQKELFCKQNCNRTA